MQTAIEAPGTQLTAVSRRQELLSETRVIARPHPLSDRTIDVRVGAGSTIADIFFDAGMDPRYIRLAQCWLCDESDTAKTPVLVPLENWERVRPRPGIVVTFRVAPHGAAGAQKGGPIGIIARVLVVIIAAVSSALTYGALAPAWYAGGVAAAVGGAVSAPGDLAISGRLPSKGKQK